MDMGDIRGILTALILLLFIGICLRAFSRKRSDEYHEAEQLPLEDGSRPPPDDPHGGHNNNKGSST